MIKGFEAPRPRIIAAAVQTPGLADMVNLSAGRIDTRHCSHEAQIDECFAGSWSPMIVAELGPRLSPLMLSRLMRGPDAPILAVLPNGQLPISQILSLALSGARFELVHDAGELPDAVRLAINSPALDCEVGESVRALAWRLDRQTLEYVAGLLILGRRRNAVSEAMARLDGTAVIRNALRERALPKPTRLLGWGAALHLMWQMEHHARNFPDAARILGFESSRACSDAFKFHTGHAPMNVLYRCGFAGMLEEFVRRLGDSRDLLGPSATSSIALPA